jgi:hypothetical protein
MKALLIFLMMCFSGLVSAEVCTSVIKDRRGYEWETFTRSSYSQQSACDFATYDCNGALSYGQSMGRYYDAFCVIKFDRPIPPQYPLVCQTDLVDPIGGVLNSFKANGMSEWEACSHSDNFCKSALSKIGKFGFRCINRGLINDRNDPLPPNSTKTEQCLVYRQDAYGAVLQSYYATATGPYNSDVHGDACRKALNFCMPELRNNQFCNIVR